MEEFVEEIKISGEYIELIGLLKFIGIASSGSEAKMLVDEGNVKVNGQTEYRRRAKLYRGSEIEVNNHKFRIA